MDYRRLGVGGPTVSAIGLGCFPMTGGYGTADLKECRAAIECAVGAGITLFDTSDSYADGANEAFIGDVLAPFTSNVSIITKFGFVPGSGLRKFDASPGVVRERCEASLRRLAVEAIDLYLPHRLDPAVPLEETVGAMSELVFEGKVRYVGVPDSTADDIRRAHAVHTVTFVMKEYSLWERSAEENLFPTLGELGVGVVAHSPLGRGMLGGGLDAVGSLDEDDLRRKYPKFQTDQIARHTAIAQRVVAMATDLGVTPAQMVIAWILTKNKTVIPIPGSRRTTHIESNLAALDLRLDDVQMTEMEELAGSLRSVSSADPVDSGGGHGSATSRVAG